MCLVLEFPAWGRHRHTGGRPQRWRNGSLSALKKGQGSCACWAWRRLRWIWAVCVDTWKEGAKADPGSFQWCQVPGAETTNINWNTGNFLWTSGNTFLLWQWYHRMPRGVVQSLSLHGDIPKLSGYGPGYLSSSWPCLSQGWIGKDDLQRSFPTSSNLWFCEHLLKRILILLMQRASVGMQDWGLKVIKNAFSEPWA